MVCWAIHPISGSYICFSIAGFYFLNQMEYYRAIHLVTLGILSNIHLVTVGLLSSHPPRYSWNIIEHPPRYSWNIIESSTSLRLDNYLASYLVTENSKEEKLSKNQGFSQKKEAFISLMSKTWECDLFISSNSQQYEIYKSFQPDSKVNQTRISTKISRFP